MNQPAKENTLLNAMNRLQISRKTLRTDKPSLKELFKRLEQQIMPYTFTDPYEFAKRDRCAVLGTIGEMQLELVEINDLVLSIENDVEKKQR